MSTHWKYFIRDSSVAPLENEYFEWARKQFGNMCDARWYANFQGYWFSEENDVTLFLLRWGDNPNLTGLQMNHEQ